LTDKIFDLNPYKSTTSALEDSAVVETPLNDKLYIQRVYLEFQIRNLVGNSTMIDIIAVMPRSNTARDAYVTWDDAMNNSALGQPGVNPPTIASGSWTPTEGKPIKDAYGTSPLYEKAFTSAYKVIKRWRFPLNGGSLKRIYYTMDFNKMIERDYLLNMNASGVAWIKGLGVQFMLIHRPSIAVGVNGGVEKATYPSSKLAVSWTRRMTLKSVSPNRVSLNRVVHAIPTLSSSKFQYIGESGTLQDQLPV